MTPDVTSEVLAYLAKARRPYNVQNIYDNLHHKYSKKLLQTTLEEIAAKNKIEKIPMGKAVLYVYLRPLAGQPADTTLFQQLSALKEEVHELAQQYVQIKKAEHKLRLNAESRAWNMLRISQKQIDIVTQTRKRLIDHGIGNFEMVCRYRYARSIQRQCKELRTQYGSLLRDLTSNQSNTED